jgi:hypothetical protein
MRNFPITSSGKDRMEPGPRAAIQWWLASPNRRGPMLLMIVVTAMIGFVALMGYMFYLTPGPHDRL